LLTVLKLPKLLSIDFHILEYLVENGRTYFSTAMNWHCDPDAIVMTINGVTAFLSGKNEAEFMGNQNYLSCFG